MSEDKWKDDDAGLDSLLRWFTAFMIGLLVVSVLGIAWIIRMNIVHGWAT